MISKSEDAFLAAVVRAVVRRECEKRKAPVAATTEARVGESPKKRSNSSACTR